MADPIPRLNAALSGRYSIERKLGEGGMATVYLAADLRHGRNVAVKVLRPELVAAVGADRFLAEIRTTANLQHPNILPLHDSGDADGLLFYVMPYVEGESLRDHLDRKHQLSVEDAVRIATDVAGGLDYAHRHGVVHRDIKPANILLVDEKPVISDFGIALAVGVAGAGRLTETGLSLGTPHYMSPEQATGDEGVGPATDIWALGCVLYEMLAGEPPYTGSTPQAVLGKIIARHPEPVREHRKAVPPNLDAAIARALEKVPADRFSSGKEFASAVSNPAFRHGEAVVSTPTGGGARWKRVGVVAGALAVTFAGVAAWALASSTRVPEEAPRVVRFTVTTPAPMGFKVILSPDQRTIVFPMSGQLYRRALDGLDIVPIPGTQSNFEPCFSPDGEWIAFFQTTENALKRVRLDGSGLQTVTAAPSTTRSCGWSEDGTIVFNSSGLGGLHRVLASGGEPERIQGDLQGEGLFWLDVLPSGRAAIGVQTPVNGFIFSDGQIFAIPLDTGLRKFLVEGIDPEYVRTGHIVFWRNGSLWVVPFDAELLEVTGPPTLVAENVQAATNGVAYFAVDQDVLVYRPGGLRGDGYGRPAWIDRAGNRTPLPVEAGLYETPRVSPDGTKVALARLQEDENIWIYDEAAGVATQLTFAPGNEVAPAWTPDGTRIVYGYAVEGEYGLFSIASDGGGQPERLTTSQIFQAPHGFTPDGATLIFSDYTPTDENLWTLSMQPGSVPESLLTGAITETFADLSPDGRFLAYQSTQPGFTEVFVNSFPPASAGRLVSTLDAGLTTGFPNADPREARWPMWSRDGRELFYRSGQAFIRIRMNPADGRPLGAPEVLFTGELTTGYNARSHDIAPDGRRFVAIVSGSTSDIPANELIVVENWFEEVRERLAN